MLFFVMIFLDNLNHILLFMITFLFSPIFPGLIDIFLLSQHDIYSILELMLLAMVAVAVAVAVAPYTIRYLSAESNVAPLLRWNILTKWCSSILMLCCHTLEVKYSHQLTLINTTAVLPHIWGKCSHQVTLINTIVMLPHFWGRMFSRTDAHQYYCYFALLLRYNILTKWCSSILLLCRPTFEVEYSNKLKLINDTVVLPHI